MLKSHERQITLLQKSLDFLILLVAWSAAFLLKFESFSSGYTEKYFNLFIPVVILSYYFLRREGVYSSQRLKGWWSEPFATFAANSYSFFAIIIFFYFIGGQEKVSREFLIYYYLLSSSFLLLSKISIRMLLLHLRRKGHNLRHIVLFGSGPQAADYVNEIKSRKELGLEIKYWVDSNGLCDQFEIPCLENFNQQICREVKPDYIVFSYNLRDYNKIEKVLGDVKNELVNTIILPDVSFALIGYEIGEFNGIPLISINQPKLSHRNMIMKRVFDVLLSGLGLIILSPLLLLISLLVKFSSPGPIFFGQKRMGLDGQIFTMWKFRSMKMDNSESPGWTVENDPRRTAIGKFLRSSSIDELPQLWNVFVGDMSLVGPRPEQPHFVNEFRDNIPSYMLRHRMKAGITGWAQVNGWRGDTSLVSRIECDIYYIKNWSIWLDVRIIFMTLWKGFINKNAY